MAILEIENVDRDAYLYDYEFTKTLEWYNSQGTILLNDDISNTLRGSLDKFQDIKIYDDDEINIEFRGVIVDIEQEHNDNGHFALSIQDYWYLFTRKHITKTYTSMTASAIIKDIISTYFASDFTVVGVNSTVTTYTYRLRGRNVAKFLQELADLEGFIILIDTTKDLVFKAETTTSTGKTWVYADGDMLDEKFDSIGRDIVNAVFVEGRAGSPLGVGVGAYYVDSALVSALNGKILEMSKIVDSTLTTIKQCRDRGETEVRRRNQTAPIGMVKGIKDFDVDIGKIHTMTIAHRGYSNSSFLVRSATHKYAADTTTIKVIYTSKDNSELVSDVLIQARQLQEIETDDNTIFPKFIQATDDLILKAYVSVENRSSQDNYYGNNYYGNLYYGSQNTGSYTEVLAEEQINVMNEGIEGIMRILSQVGTVPNVLDHTNTHIAVGNSSTAINFSDTAINNETARQQGELGSPDDNSENMLIAHYKMNGNAKDSSGFNRDGTNNGVSFVSGKIGNAGDFERSELDYIDLPTLINFTEITVSIWFKLEQVGSLFHYFLDLDNGSSNRLFFYVSNASKLVFAINGTVGTTTQTYLIDTWYHAIIIYNGSTAILYVDNVSILTISPTGDIDLSSLSNGARIGSFANGALHQMDGLIDDVRIYNYALSTTEIADIYNSGTGRETGVATYQISWDFLITDDDITSGTINNVGLLNASSLGELFFAGVLSTAVNKIANEEQKITIRLTFEVSNYYLTNAGRKLIRDLLIGASTNYMDNAGSWIEIQTTTPYRDSMATSYPDLNQAGTKLIYQTEITAAEILANSLDGETYTGMDLVDAASAGNTIFDGEVGYTVDVNDDEPQSAEVIINGVRE